MAVEDVLGLKGCAEALAPVVINLFDKIEHACGWFATPKGRRKDREEAVKYLINEIEKDSNMPPYLKAVKIANARKDIKEYNNKNDIVSIAAGQLSDKAQPESVDDDWLSYFFDKAKCVSHKDIQIIWGKLLAEECEQPRSVPKSLISVLTSLDTKDAQAFNALCNCSFIATDEDNTVIPFIDVEKNKEFYENIGLTFQELSDLESIGLIRFDPTAGYCVSEKTCSFIYFDAKLTVAGDRPIDIGNVIFTSTGMALKKFISPDYIEEILDMFREFLEKERFNVDIVMKNQDSQQN